MSAGALSASLSSSEDLRAQARDENFPVALRLLGAETRRHLMAIYAFARLADDIGDEAEGDRLALLDWLDADLGRAFAGSAEHPVLRDLAPTLRALELPLTPFHRLIEANRRDQHVSRYETFDDLLGYCALSAEPVGELVLRVFGALTPQNRARSNRVCTALQLVEHWQDLAEDHERGRVYLPQEDLARFGCDEAELGRSSAGPRLRALVHFQAERARTLLDESRPLVAALSGRGRIAVAGFAAGGYAALDALARCDGDVLAVSARPLRRDVARHLLRLLRRAGSRR